jgi:ribosomal protein S24E
MKIIEEKENKLLKRVELTAKLGFAEKATPSNADVAKMLASATKKPEENIVVKSIYTRYGDTSADVKAYVYNSKSDKESIEPTTKAMKDKAEKAAKPAEAEEAKPAEKKEEAPAEVAKPVEAKPAEKKEEAK